MGDSKRESRIRAPRQDRSAETVKAIEQAIDEIVAKDGPTSLTARAVAERAGVGPGTLYRYFRTREAMVASWELRQLGKKTQALFAYVQESVASDRPLPEVVHEVARRAALVLMGHVATNGREFLSTLSERQSSAQPAVAMFVSALEHARGRHPGLPADLTVVVRVAVGAVAMTSVLTANRGPTPEEAEATAAQIADMVTRYLVDPALLVPPRAPSG